MQESSFIFIYTVSQPSSLPQGGGNHHHPKVKTHSPLVLRSLTQKPSGILLDVSAVSSSEGQKEVVFSCD